ncbi:NADH-quinone oxidoreductase subunit M [Candidatus Atelocyanobacterium thalassae]|uniref:NAD(P)H-quinone oxidoreductase chain 4 1 n=1 Tax=cyanobacterium endosymbiont of Braarudosphaera bigelowii TaxID=1285375 RepID=A0ABM7U4G7_9CHRO|nr:NADH-quinone oxidoreductase subunit M [Candidatus Atelocyanobacterium thalassa]BDA39600.1 NAD(P)H-quinone oxidoreductase chain 4 1 [cyanobacterium endosymbiont of Braarudosphaera bigelowii]
MPVLSCLIWLPLLSAILIIFFFKQQDNDYCRLFAIFISVILLALTIAIGFKFNVSNPEIQFYESFLWIDRIGLNYSLGIDGLSLPLVCLNNFLTLITIYSSSKNIQRQRFYYGLILILNSGISGAFLSQDLLLFFIFYELETIPLYFLLVIWGGIKRDYASIKFLIYTSISGIFIFISFLGLVWLSGIPTFNYWSLRFHSLSPTHQLFLLIPLLVGLSIKIPIVPFHAWLPDTHVEASTPVSILLAGVLLKLGTYGLLRFGVGLFTDAWIYLSPMLATLAVISALYGAFCAIAQKDMKKVVAYSSISHMAYVLLALSANTSLSLNAAVFQMISHGLISALLFFLVGIVYEKTGSRDVDFLSGLFNSQNGLPITGSLIILGVMASSGIPGMIGFIAEFLVFRGSFPVFPIQTLLCLIGSGLTAVYFLLMVNRVFFGRLTPRLIDIPRIYWSERSPALLLAVLIIMLGIQPSWLLRWSETSINTLLIR